MHDIIDGRTAPVSPAAARIAFGGAAAALALLAGLHVLSPEFAPSWRMVSEYANGAHGWALSLMFLVWAVSSWALAVAVRQADHSRLATAGVVLLAIAGLGEALAAVFDITHPLHSVAAALGILGLPVAALCVGLALARRMEARPKRRTFLWLSNLPWISVALMAASFAALFASLDAAGVDMSAQTGPLTALPEGVVAWNGWANRVLIVVYCLWAMAAAQHLADLRPVIRSGR